MSMDRDSLLQKMAWQLQPSWHFRGGNHESEWSVKQTVKALQTLLLSDGGAFLEQTLSRAAQRPVDLETLDTLVITLFQEGAVQRVWRAEATLNDGTTWPFGIIVARASGAGQVITQREFDHLQQLHACQPQYCVKPYVNGGSIALSGDPTGGMAAFSVEWLETHKELVFEIVRDGGVFFVNAVGHHHAFSPEMSRRIWRRMIAILWSYPGLGGVNIQAGDFVGQFQDEVSEDHDAFDLKLTTARDLQPTPGPVERIHELLGYGITASGYLSDGKKPFDRQMTEDVFRHRMQSVLQRRFRDRAERLAQHQWALFRQGVFARQEDHLREDYILATYDHLQTTLAPTTAWRETQKRWLAYTEAAQSGAVPPCWWFPAPAIPQILNHLTRHLGMASL